MTLLFELITWIIRQSAQVTIVLLLGAAIVVFALPYTLPLDNTVMQHPSEFADANGAFVRVSGEGLYYTHTPGSGEVVLLLHGFGGSTVTWIDTAPALAAAGYDVYAVDMLGFGLSDKGWQHDYSHPAQAARVIGLMDALGIDRAVIIGHSMGGNVAAHLALSYPERVSALVLVSAAIVDNSAAAHGGSFLPVPPGLLKLPFVRQWGQVLSREFIAPMFDDLLASAATDDSVIRPEIVEGYRRALRTPEWDLGLMGMTRDGDRNALPALLDTLDLPVLLLWGAADTWVPASNSVRLEALIPGAQRVEFAGVGHLPMHEAPDLFNAALLEFLAARP